jgi:hypothetical protein
MWRSTDFRNMGPLPPSAPALWLYLLTGEHRTKVPGLFVLGVGTMSDDLRWQPAAVRKHIKTLVDQHHVRMDDSSNVVWLPKALDHNPPENPNVVMGWKRDWQAIPESPLKNEAKDAIREWFSTFPPPEKSKVTYAEAFAVATGERKAPGSADDKSNVPANGDGTGGGNVPPDVGPNDDGTMGGIEEREGDGERKKSSSSGPSRDHPPVGADAKPKTITRPAVPVVPANIDPESTDPTDLLNAIAGSSNNVFDRFAGGDAELPFLRRLADYGINARRATRLGLILANHTTTMPKMWVKKGEKVRMSLLMGPCGSNGQRGGTWLSIAVGVLEEREAADAEKAARLAAPAGPQAPRPVIDDNKRPSLVERSRLISNANKSNVEVIRG